MSTSLPTRATVVLRRAVSYRAEFAAGEQAASGVRHTDHGKLSKLAHGFRADGAAGALREHHADGF